GNLGPLQVSATDVGSHVFGDFTVNLHDPSGHGHLTLSEIAGSSLTQLVTASFSGAANIRLALTAGFGSTAAFPTITSGLSIDWSFNSASTASAGSSFGSTPTIQFTNVQLDVGQAVTQV